MNKNASLALSSLVGLLITFTSYGFTYSILNGIVQTIKFNTNASYFSGEVGLWAVEMSLQLNKLQGYLTVGHVLIGIIFLLCLAHGVVNIAKNLDSKTNSGGNKNVHNN